MCVEKLWINTDWDQTWKNLNESPVPETTRSVWYRVIHEIIPSNERLPRINMVQANTFRQCASKDTLEHRLLVRGAERMNEIIQNPNSRDVRTTANRLPDD